VRYDVAANSIIRMYGQNPPGDQTGRQSTGGQFIPGAGFVEGVSDPHEGPPLIGLPRGVR
jgi:hypothetical protein